MNKRQKKRHKQGVKAHQENRVSQYNPGHEKIKEARLVKKQISTDSKKRKNKLLRIRKLVKIGVLTEERGEKLEKKLKENDTHG